VVPRSPAARSESTWVVFFRSLSGNRLSSVPTYDLARTRLSAVGCGGVSFRLSVCLSENSHVTYVVNSGTRIFNVQLRIALTVFAISRSQCEATTFYRVAQKPSRCDSKKVSTVCHSIHLRFFHTGSGPLRGTVPYRAGVKDL